MVSKLTAKSLKNSRRFGAGIYPSGCIYHSIVLDKVYAFRRVVSILSEIFGSHCLGG